MNFFEKKLPENLERNVFWCTFASVLKTASRGGAVVARWAHNPKAGGSIPSPATFEERFFLSSFCFISLPLKLWLTCKSRGNKTFSLLNPRWPVSNSFYH